MLRKLPLLLAALFAFASPASAEEWWWVNYYGDRPDRVVEFIDKDSMTTDYSGRVSAWSFQIVERLQSDGVRKKKILSRYDCRARTVTLLESISYGNNNKLVKSFSWKSYEQEANNVVPGTIGESNWEFACKGTAAVSSPLQTSPEEFAAALFKADTD